MKDNEDLIKWNKQSEKDLYKEACSTWDFYGRVKYDK